MRQLTQRAHHNNPTQAQVPTYNFPQELQFFFNLKPVLQGLP